MKNLIETIPAIALRGTTILPGMIIHFDVSRQRSIKAIEAAMLKDQKIFLVSQKDPDVETPGLLDLYQIGTIAYIKQVVKLPQNLIRVLVEGIERAELLSIEKEQPYLEFEIAHFAEEGDLPIADNVKKAMCRSLKELFQSYCSENGKISRELVSQILNIEDVEQLVDQICVHLPIRYQDKQRLLEAVTLSERYELLGVILSNEIQIIQITHDLQKKVKERVDKNQREYILREQLNLIREELGEDNPQTDAEKYKKQAEELTASREVKDKIIKEIDRFKSINANAAESPVLRTYIETLLALPWEHYSRDCEDLKEANRILEEDHYGLKDVKQRIMEFLAVRLLTQKGKSPILCLVGPPGTGKTSIAKSVARALNKKYVRICLGGVKR